VASSEVLTPFPDLKETAPLDDLAKSEVFRSEDAASIFIPPNLAKEVFPIWELCPPISSELPWTPNWVQVVPRDLQAHSQAYRTPILGSSGIRRSTLWRWPSETQRREVDQSRTRHGKGDRVMTFKAIAQYS
jgi:hypothetical protein